MAVDWQEPMVWERNAAATTHTTAPSTTPGLHPVSIHQMSPPVRGSKHPITVYYSVYRPLKDERLSWPGWLVTYRNKVTRPRHQTEIVNGAHPGAYTRAMSEHRCFPKKRLSIVKYSYNAFQVRDRRDKCECDSAVYFSRHGIQVSK